MEDNENGRVYGLVIMRGTYDRMYFSHNPATVIYRAYNNGGARRSNVRAEDKGRKLFARIKARYIPSVDARRCK